MPEITLFTWVHLSDIHFGHGNSAIQWDQKLVLKQLINDLESREEKKLPFPKAIFITGDIAETGDDSISNNKSEYKAASVFIQKLCTTLNIKHDDVYLIPGNHDLQRKSASDRKINRLIKEIKNDKDQIDNALADIEDRELLLSLFKNYISFSEQFGPKDINRNETFWHYKFKLEGGIDIVIVALNSAFLATGVDDFGQLQLGNEQLKFILEESKNDIVIVLSHHPFEWLYDNSNISTWINNHGHIHLCGHVHDAQSESLRKGGGTSFIRIVSGASHSDNKVVGHGYSLGAIILKDGEFFVRIWPRKWTKDKIFKLDHDNVPEGHTFADHPLKLKYSSSVAKKEILGSDEKFNIPIKLNRDSDPRSSLNIWVGRELQLQHFKDNTIKVFAITGIGGQGKSFLASKFIELLPDLFPEIVFWDWRDCREESDTFQTQILNIIERITDGKVPAYAFRDESIATIIDTFFKLIEESPGVFIFDNIDHYIDVDANKPTLGIATLIEHALKRKHKSKFILTCRPEVKYNDSAFFQILLPGMNQEESLSLFQTALIDTSDVKIINEIDKVRELTKGHPMWLNVIAQQVSKNHKELSTIIDELESGINTDLDITMMRSVWNVLNSNQKIILRCMAETVRPETLDTICDYMAFKIRAKLVSKAIKILKTLNLISVKNSQNSKDSLELHPIVKAYIRNEFIKSEQITYIDIISSYYDKCIKKYSRALDDCVSFKVLTNWTLRAELAINAGKFKDSLKILNDVSNAMLSAGHSEEFLRVSGRLLNSIDFDEAILQDYKYFDSVLKDYVQVLGHLGRYDVAEATLVKYEYLVGKTARYINLCDMRCYFYWDQSKFEDAKIWGRAGLELKKSSNIDTHFDCSNNYALAQRDSDEIDDALKQFLGGILLDEVVNERSFDRERTGEFYGNIGRCLHLKGDIAGALVCYRKSLTLLEAAKSKLTILNRGKGYFWVGEALEQIGNKTDAYAFYHKAMKLWETSAPPKAEKAVAAINKLKTDGDARSAEEGENLPFIPPDMNKADSIYKKYLF